MGVNPKEIKNGVIFYLRDDISVDAVKDFHKEVEPFLNPKVRNMVFDFEGVDYICSAGLGIIANAYKKLAQENGRVYATNVSERIEKILKATTLDQFLILRNNTDEVIKTIEDSA